mgnify:CR=1 FL=1
MIKISEHSGYSENDVKELEESVCELLSDGYFKKEFHREKDTQLCFSIQHVEGIKYKIYSSYMIGVDWVVKNKLPIYVQPKLNTEATEVDYLKMLFEATEDPENLKHLKGLYEIDFKAPLIKIEQNQDRLTPLLLLEFLQLIKQIVRKGLKKSYYKVTQNLNSRVKGKLLVSATVKQNHTKNKGLYQVCQFDEFGYNSVENRILKKTLLFVQAALNQLKGVTTKEIKTVFQYVFPAFNQVSDQVDLREIKTIKSNPMFKEYSHALRIAGLILKKYGYNISKAGSRVVETPPFWIDMSKLFELYVFKKLKEVFPNRGEIIYHKKFDYLESDYLLQSRDGRYKMVIDAKYKPRYVDNQINHDDGRQVSGYARLKKIRNELNIENKETVDALIIYSNQKSEHTEFNSDTLLEIEDRRYFRLFKYGIQLPVITINQ